MTQKSIRDAFIKNGVTFVDADTVYFLANDTVIGAGTTVEPFVIIGTGVKIGKNVTVRGFTHLEDCTLADNATVGPFARVRGGTTLGEHAFLGNFVEAKNAHLGQNVKSGHLTYLGDTTIGDNTNIGAGTITCNYDGYRKNSTTIGKNCFIGSHTTLVAPTSVGDGALTAAGSVITRPIAPDALAIARAELREIPGGATAYHQRKKENS